MATVADVRRIALGLPGAAEKPSHDGLAWLDAIGEDRLREVIVESWLARAPKKLAEEFLANGQ